MRVGPDPTLHAQPVAEKTARRSPCARRLTAPDDDNDSDDDDDDGGGGDDDDKDGDNSPPTDAARSHAGAVSGFGE